MAEDITGYIAERMPDWRSKHPGVETMRVAVMGCVVNGPGESKHAHIGISLPGKPTLDMKKLQTWKGGVVNKLTTLNDYDTSGYFNKGFIANHFGSVRSMAGSDLVMKYLGQ